MGAAICSEEAGEALGDGRSGTSMHYSRSAASRAGNVHSSKIKSLSFVELEALWRDNTECYSAAGAGLRQRLERVAVKKKKPHDPLLPHVFFHVSHGRITCRACSIDINTNSGRPRLRPLAWISIFAPTLPRNSRLWADANQRPLFSTYHHLPSHLAHLSYLSRT